MTLKIMPVALKIHHKKKHLHEELEENHHRLEYLTRELKKYNEEYGKYVKKHPKIAKLQPVYDVVRVATGIKGFDELIEGGVPEKSLVLLSGPTGAGKSIFSMRFLIEGAMRGEPGIYVSLKESIDETINQMRFFGWPIDRLVEENKILIIQPELYNFDALLTSIEDAIDRIKAKRLIIDTVSIIGMYFEQPFKIRKALLDLGYLLKKLNCTTIAISEIDERQKTLSPYGVEEFIADGVVVLYYIRIRKGSSFLRAIAIRKMRSTKHSINVHPVEIKRPGGILVHAREEVFTDVR